LVTLTIDIVHTELLSLHTAISDDSAGSIVTHTLFGDGLIRYSLKQESEMEPGEYGLKVLTLDEVILPKSSEYMSWKLKDHQFKMTLDRAVPVCIKNNVESLVRKLHGNINIAYDDKVKDDSIFSIHPGGPKIINNIAKKLKLSQEQISHSNDVLYENGNISSTTIPTILKGILDDESIPSGKRIVALAFGPGLTAAGAIFEKVMY
jgi:alkylresorcinol/alkylpyrone synthase